MTFYKYAERQASSQVNWAELSKSLSDTFLEEQKLREEKKAAIDKATNDYATTLQEQPLSDNVTVKEWWLKSAEDLTQAKLMSTRMLKEGKMRLADYNVYSQNLQDGTTNLINAMKSYNEEYKIKKERLMSQDPATASQKLEAWEAEQLEKLTDLSNSKIYIDPTNGSMSIAKTEEKEIDGQKVRVMSGERVSANQIMSMLGSKYNKFDLNGALAAEEKMLGKYTDVITMAVGPNTSIIEYENPALRETLDAEARDAFNNFYTYRDNMIESYMANPLNVSSILTDYTGKDYDFTTDPNDTDPMKILVKQTSSGKVPVFDGPKGQEQLKEASDYMRNKFMNMIDVVEKSKGISRPPTPAKSRQKSASEVRTAGNADNYYNKIASLMRGTDLNNAISFLVGDDPNRRILRDDTGVTVSYANNTTQRRYNFADYGDEGAFVDAMSTALVPQAYRPALLESIRYKGNTPVTPAVGVAGEESDIRPIEQKTSDLIVDTYPFESFSASEPTYTKSQIANSITDALSWAVGPNQKQLIKVMPSTKYGSVYIANANGTQLGDRVYEVASTDKAKGKREYDALIKAISGQIGALSSEQKTTLNTQYENSPNAKYPAKVD